MIIPNFLTMTLGPTPWLVAGLMLLSFSLLVPRPIVAALGFAGVLTAVAARHVAPLPSQLFIWGMLSGGFTLMLRGLVPQESKALEPVRYARVLEPIATGGVGRVHYAGSSWLARCQISDGAIAPGSQVTVVGRQGNTLIIVPIPAMPLGADQTSDAVS